MLKVWMADLWRNRETRIKMTKPGWTKRKETRINDAMPFLLESCIILDRSPHITLITTLLQEKSARISLFNIYI